MWFILGYGRLLSWLWHTLCHACGQSQQGWTRHNSHILPEHQLGCQRERRHFEVSSRSMFRRETFGSVLIYILWTQIRTWKLISSYILFPLGFGPHQAPLWRTLNRSSTAWYSSGRTNVILMKCSPHIAPATPSPSGTLTPRSARRRWIVPSWRIAKRIMPLPSKRSPTPPRLQQRLQQQQQRHQVPPPPALVPAHHPSTNCRYHLLAWARAPALEHWMRMWRTAPAQPVPKSARSLIYICCCSLPERCWETKKCKLYSTHIVKY